MNIHYKLVKNQNLLLLKLEGLHLYTVGKWKWPD